MNAGEWVQIVANVLIVGGGVGSLVRAVWRAVRSLERMTIQLNNHEQRLQVLEGRGQRQAGWR